MSLRAGLADTAFYLVVALILAALTHFAIVLAIPLVAAHDAYARLSAIGPIGATYLAPRAAPSERLAPWADPAVASAFCLFDLTKGPLRVREPVGRAGFASLSFHSRHGAVFYALTDRAATKGWMDAVLVTPAQLRVLIAQDDEDDPSQDLRIVSSTPQGFIMVRVFSELPSLYDEAEAQAKALSCAPEPPMK